MNTLLMIYFVGGWLVSTIGFVFASNKSFWERVVFSMILGFLWPLQLLVLIVVVFCCTVVIGFRAVVKIIKGENV